MPCGDSRRKRNFTLPAGRVERSEGRGRDDGVAVGKVLLTLSPPRPLARPTLPREGDAAGRRRGSASDT